MLASKIIHDVSVDLNDNYPHSEYLRWTESQLRSYYEEAVIEAVDSYKQLFYKTVVVPVESKAGWQSACECTHIKRISGECTEDGTLISRMVRQKDATAYTWTGDVGTACSAKTTDAHSLWGYTINSVQDNQFQVYPTPLPTEQRYVLVECYQEPDTSDASFDVPQQFVAIIKQWMLYRALIVDSENNPAIATVAKTHLETYMALLQRLDAKSKKMEEDEERDERDSVVRAVQDGASKQVSQ